MKTPLINRMLVLLILPLVSSSDIVQKCQNMDLSKYMHLVETNFSGRIFKKAIYYHHGAKLSLFLSTTVEIKAKERIQCQNGGYFADREENRCVCLFNYAGRHCERFIEDCSEGYHKGSRVNGVYTIQPKLSSSPFQVYCMMRWGGRSLIQRQVSGVNFTRTWHEYKHGFGNVRHDHWLGLENIRQIATSVPSYLCVYIKTKHGAYKQSHYRYFMLQAESDGYRMFYLKCERGKGLDLSDGLKDQNGSRFSTWDRDNDEWDDGSCADVHGSGWWFNNCTRCNPNGVIKQTSGCPKPRMAYWSGEHLRRTYIALSRE